MKATEKRRKNVKRWKKGQSCVSNPDLKKYRSAAKNRFFNVVSGPSQLTTAAVAKHTAETDGDGDAIIADGDTQSSYSRGTTATWATSWTDCTNATFSKVNRYVSSQSNVHKSVLAVLAAVTEVIKASDGKETDTEYFAALMTALDNRTNDDDTISAVVYLLSLCIKRVPIAVLKSKFSDATKLLMNILSDRSDTVQPAMLRSILKCIAVLLRAQDQITWSQPSTIHVYNSLLSFTTHAKPKVRKSSEQAVCSVLFGSHMMTTEAPPPTHPAATLTAKYCISQIEAHGGGGEATVTLHTLGLLQHILHTLPKSTLKSTCETILKLMTLSNVMVSTVCMKCLHKMFSSKPDHKSMPAELNAQIITALYEYQPGENDTQLMSAWVSVLTAAHTNLARVGEDLFISHCPRYVSVTMNCMKANNTDVNKLAGSNLATLITEHLAPLGSRLGKMLRSAPTPQSPAHRIVSTIESGLSYQYHAAWDHVLKVIAAMFLALGKDCNSVMKKGLHSLADLRESHNFGHKGALDEAVGMAVRTMGPRVVLDAIPLQISGHMDDYDFPRSWLLPVLRENIRDTEMLFFTEYFMPLAARLHDRAVKDANEGRTVEARTYEALQLQMWSLLPGFSTRPTDLSQSFKGVAKILGFAIKDREDIRMEVMASLRKLILQNVDHDENKAEVARFAKNFLPLLFNLFTTAPDNEKDLSRMAVLETIKIYAQIADPMLVATYIDMCMTKLAEEESASFKTYALLDLCIGLVSYTDKSRLPTVLEYIAENIKDDDRTVQKKCYRILEMMCASTAPGCRMYVAASLDTLQTTLCDSLAGSAPSAKAPRLRCLCHIFRQLDTEQMDFLQKVVPEAVLCVKETGEKARTAAYGLLTQMVQSLLAWNPDTPKRACVQMYGEIVMAGLAGNPHMVACTLLALAHLTHTHSDYMSDEIVLTLLDSCCILLESGAREIVKSALVLLKELVARFDDATIGRFLEKIVTALVGMKESNKHQLRYKAKEIFTKLVRKFGYGIVISHVPESHHKMLGHIRKMQERAKKRRDKPQMEEGEEDEEGTKDKPETFDEFLADSDSDLDDNVSNKKKKAGKAPGGDQQPKGKGAAWLAEAGETIDFLDPSVSHKVLSTKPGAAKKQKSSDDAPFKLAADGRMIIQEEQEEPKESGGAAPIDDLDELLDAFEGAGKKSKSRKRKMAVDDEEEDEKPMKYKAGGKGIHRALSAPGEEYRAKKARGDMKRKDKPDPYAYIPLQMAALNKRKKAKVKGQFKNFVKGAQKGAAKGQKIRAKNKKH